MAIQSKSWTLGEIAAAIGGRVGGTQPEIDGSFVVTCPTSANGEDATGLCFAGDEKYLNHAKASTVGAVIVPESVEGFPKPHILHKNPRAAFAMFLGMNVRPLPLEPGVHPQAVVHPEATLGENVSIGAFAVVERGALVGAGTRVYPHAYIGENCRLGDKCVVYPHAVLVQDVVLGNRSVVGTGAVLGSDGFGFVWTGSEQFKVPQVGSVELGDNVETGALAAVDRATFGVTRIGSGTKLDNFVHVGHNVSIGSHTVIAAFTGISGSVKIGDRVTVAGQSGFGEHAEIGSDIQLGGRAGVTGKLVNPGAYMGYPAVPMMDGLKALKLSTKLPEYVQRIKDLEKRLAALEEKFAGDSGEAS